MDADLPEKYQLHEDASDYQALMLGRLNAAFDDYFRFLEGGSGLGEKA